MTWGEISWDNPVLFNQANFQKMGQNGVQLIRNWLSDWGIFASDDQPWTGVSGNAANNPGVRVPYIPPATSPTVVPPFGSSDVEFQIQHYYNPCNFYGGWHDGQGPAVKTNTKYRVFIRYLIPQALPQAVDTTKPSGLVAKVSGWLDAPLTNPNNNCAKAGSGTDITPHVTQVSSKDANGNWQWQILEGTIDPSLIGTKNFLGRIYLSMDNIDHLTVPAPGVGEIIWVDRIEIREDLGDNLCAAASGSGAPFDLSNGKCGTNIMTAPWSSYNQYYNQRFSLSFDKALELAHQNNVYLKLVILEKNEYIQNHIDYLGRGILDNQTGCLQPYGVVECPNNNWFYGNWRSVTKTRWLQQAYWRYLQARWGYSTNVHSWELINEGDPFSGLHYTLADELGKYMHQFGPNAHLVTTSNWNSFPEGTNQLWGNPSFPNLDYTDVHHYMIKGQNGSVRTDKKFMGDSVTAFLAPDWFDSASAVNRVSQVLSPLGIYGVGKPIMRGETGFVTGNSDGWNNEIQNDTSGVWLHKFVWAGINSGGLIESYWYSKQHINPSPTKDFTPEFGKYYNFIKDIPLSNGNYREASASASDTNLRAWGQKDTVNKRAHLWIDNKTHTWGNVVYATPSATIASGTTITLPNMPQGSYPISWIDTYASPSAALVKTETVNVDASGNLVLSLPQALTKDVAVKIGDYFSPAPNPSLSPSPIPTPTPGSKQGDINGDNKVDIIDLSVLLSHWLGTDTSSDINKDGKVGIIDLSILLSNWLK
ncbi:hypothetical protein HYW46_04975 [Candidatus Daviesbacteria bacterium]|nr:hypothetical protein [Candidatus Daviesbacteria bacterium]